MTARTRLSNDLDLGYSPYSLSAVDRLNLILERSRAKEENRRLLSRSGQGARPSWTGAHSKDGSSMVQRSTPKNNVQHVGRSPGGAFRLNDAHAARHVTSDSFSYAVSEDGQSSEERADNSFAFGSISTYRLSEAHSDEPVSVYGLEDSRSTVGVFED